MARRMIAVELLAGDGVLSGHTVGNGKRVHYTLEVLREVTDSRSGAEMTDLFEIVGTVAPAPSLTIERLLLRLQDGRTFHCIVTDSNGTVRSVGGFCEIDEN